MVWVHKWSGWTNYDNINVPPQTTCVVISGTLETSMIWAKLYALLANS